MTDIGKITQLTEVDPKIKKILNLEENERRIEDVLDQEDKPSLIWKVIASFKIPVCDGHKWQHYGVVKSGFQIRHFRACSECGQVEELCEE